MSQTEAESGKRGANAAGLGRGCMPGIAAGLLLGAVVAFGLLLVTGRSLFARFLGQSEVMVTSSTVIRNIQRLQRLETVVYTLDQIATGEHSIAFLPSTLAGDRILLVVHGDVTAGIDLSQIRESDIAVQGHSVHLHLPPAQIFATRIDNQKSRVYSRDTGLFTSPDPQLESEVRKQAESQLTAAAVQDGILNIARDNARATLTALLRSLGFEQAAVD